jgi:hypothetical protein
VEKEERKNGVMATKMEKNPEKMSRNIEITQKRFD